MIDVNKLKVESVALSSIVDDKTENIRDPQSKSQYDITGLQPDLLANGQKEPVLLYRAEVTDGTQMHRILQGYRRILALKDAASGELHWDDSVPVVGGKAVTHVFAKVVKEELTPADKIRLKINDTSRRNLDIVGLQLAIDEAVRAGLTEREIVSACLDLFLNFYALKKAIVLPDNPTFIDRQVYQKALLDNYKGTLQQLKSASVGPVILHDAWINHLRDKSYPLLRKQSDMVALSAIYRKELDADTSGKITRETPGPLFNAAWAKYVKNLQESALTGKTKPTGLTSMNKATMDDVRKGLSSRVLKIMLNFTLSRISRDKLPEFDAIVTAFETAAGHDLSIALDRVTDSDSATDGESPASPATSPATPSDETSPASDEVAA